MTFRDERQNIRVGVRLLRHYLDRYDGSLDLTLAAYYQGQTAADHHGVYEVTRPYIASIRARSASSAADPLHHPIQGFSAGASSWYRRRPARR